MGGEGPGQTSRNGYGKLPAAVTNHFTLCRAGTACPADAPAGSVRRGEAYRPAPGGTHLPITHMEAGGVFGDVLGGSSLASPITVVAECPCEVLLLPYDRLLQPGSDPARQQVLQNLVRTISDKYFLLSRRVDLLILKSLRAKVCAYLLSEAEYHHSMTFTIPYSRIQLADYLNCDRSALSRELSLMQRDGLLETYRSSFKIMDAEALRGMVL